MEEILCGRGGEGLFGSTKVSDLFELKGTWVSSEGPESDQSRAFIRRKLDEGLDNGANYKIGEWLGDDWQIIEITKLRVVVLNQCGFEEVLEADFGVSELDSQPEPDPVRSEQEIVDSRDFGYVVDTQITEDGSTIEFYEDGTLENYSAELGDDGQPKLTMIYRYIPEQDAYQRYAANGTPTGDPLDREFLEEYMDIHIPKPE